MSVDKRLDSINLEKSQELVVSKGIDVYSSYRNENDQGIRLGIFDEDLTEALKNPNTITIETQADNGEVSSQPLLVPIDSLEWWNAEIIKDKYGADTKAYVYVHPKIYATNRTQVEAILNDVLVGGTVIVTDLYDDDTDSPIAQIVDRAKSGEFSIEAFGGDTESRVDVFVGHVAVNGGVGVREAPSLYDVYQQSLESGQETQASENGPSLAATIEGEEAEEIWKIYENPFEDLGRDDPTLAGFNKEQLMDILTDPDVIKVVNRVNGEITTMCIFLQNCDKAPWFNKHYYEREYPDYYRTNNILMFPGIVSDEDKRGNKYAMDVINLANRLLARRGSDFLVTFECTEVSSTYIPKIVEGAVNSSGVTNITGLDTPKTVINYYAIKKS